MHPTNRTPPQRQRGSVVINATIALSLLVIVLVGVELGYLFFMKREYQKTADLAALAGAQKLTNSNAATLCSLAESSAIANALKNSSGATIQPECGNWNPDNESNNNESDCFKGIIDRFNKNSTEINAVRVRISQSPPTLLPFFPGTRTICVQAVASLDAPVAAFTVGSRLLRLEDNTIFPNLLTTLGVNPSNVDILSYNGLANTSITPAGLLKALGVPISGDVDVGTLNALASIKNLTLGGLLDASILALQNQGGVIDLPLDLLGSLRTHLSAAALGTKVQLFGNESSPGILVGLDSTGKAALNAKVDLLSLVTAGATVANGHNLVALNNLGIGILGVQAKASIIEPPAIGIGGVHTKAKTAQIRVYLRINSSGSILGPVLNIFGTDLDIPLILELAQSTGELTDINCQAPRHNATIAVSSSQANICIGRFHDMTAVKDNDSAHFFTENNRCSPDSSGAFPDSVDGVRRHQLLNVLGILPLTVRVGIPLLESQDPVKTPPLNVPSVPPDGTSMATVNATTLDFDKSVNNIADAIAAGILGDLFGQGAIASSTQRNTLASELVGSGYGGSGKSITQVGNDLRSSKGAVDQLNAQLTSGGLGDLLGGVLQGVGNLVSGLVLDPVADLLCAVTLGGPSAVRMCRINHVRDVTISSGPNLLSGVLSMVIDILKPVLTSLSGVATKLLEALGLSLGQTDVSLLSVDCGVAKLVQ